MKILYIFEKYPTTYQAYILSLIVLFRKKILLKVLTYSQHDQSDIVINTYGYKDYLYRLCYFLGINKFQTYDIKKMMEFDIIHIQHSFLFSKVIPLFEFQNRPKIIITLRGADSYIKPWVDQRWRDFYSDYGSQVDAFITVSEHQKGYLKKWGIREEKIHVIPISFGSFSTAQPKYPNKDKLRLVSAFRMTWEKNIEGCIQFAKLLKERKIPFTYDIYGDGHDLGQLYFLIDRYELSEFINVKGKIENNLLKQLLAGYDFFVQLSISEALSSSVLEAQSQGLPCIVSYSGGLPEAVLIKETAIVHNYWDTNKMVDECIELWKDKDLYFQYSNQAIAFVNEFFTVEKEMEKLEKLYRNL